jgi:hypothetical protein
VVLLTLALTCTAPLLLPVDRWLQGLLMVLCVSFIAAGFWQAGWWGSRRLQRIVWLGDGRWLLSRREGSSFEVRLLGDSRLAPGVVWLRWQSEQPQSGLPSRPAMVLSSSDIPPADWRRLRVRLALEGVKQSSNNPLQGGTLGGPPQFAAGLRRFAVRVGVRVRVLGALNFGHGWWARSRRAAQGDPRVGV